LYYYVLLFILDKFHTLARSGGFSPKLATYELCELDEYKRARQQRQTSVTDEELMDQLKDYEHEVSASCVSDWKNVFVFSLLY